MSVANRHRTLATSGADSERRGGFRAVGATVSKLVAPVVARRGAGMLVRLKADWQAIVGSDWALAAWPAVLTRDGVLKLRTVPAAALELQHRAPLLIERINLYFGRPAVTRLVLMQGIPPGALTPHPPKSPLLDAREMAALDRRLAGIADPELRAALARLGSTVIAIGNRSDGGRRCANARVPIWSTYGSEEQNGA
jgi:hypothetical protein